MPFDSLRRLVQAFPYCIFGGSNPRLSLSCRPWRALHNFATATGWARFDFFCLPSWAMAMSSECHGYGLTLSSNFIWGLDSCCVVAGTNSWTEAEEARLVQTYDHSNSNYPRTHRSGRERQQPNSPCTRPSGPTCLRRLSSSWRPLRHCSIDWERSACFGNLKLGCCCRTIVINIFGQGVVFSN